MHDTHCNSGLIIDIKPCVKQVIEVMELLYIDDEISKYSRINGPWPTDDLKRVKEDFAELEYSSQKAVLVDHTRILINQVIRRQVPAIWFIRKHRPVTVLLSVICEQAEIPFTHICEGELTDENFENLTIWVGNIAGAPLKICDASQRESFKNACSTLVLSEWNGLVLCDWVLEEDEIAVAEYLTAKRNISFVSPY